ncbi:MAG TPA: two-component sensor histidine kinase, partial [Acetobacteraceae bacterium]|nr:two-component sensor histidine kinase [Acetobacteraceae bacterium]
MLALVVLGALGLAPVGPLALAAGVILVAAFGLALRWTRDLAILSDSVHRLNSDRATTGSGATPVLPGLQRLVGELDRLGRRVAVRSAMLEQLRRADGTVVERLPDPLIVLAADRSVRRANSAARAAFGADIGAVLRHPQLRAAIDRAFASGVTEVAEVALRVPVPREVHAAVVPMDPPIADGGRAV